jgi:PD-(D/E)XK nuclease superfamily
MADALSRQELEAAHCWEADDRVPGRPEMTEFRRRLRYEQARWRESNGHPIGSQPIVPRAVKRSRPVGSRMPLDYARESGANFVTGGALAAARTRTSFVEPHQSFDHQRLWTELLWSPTMAFNVFGDLAADLELADKAVHTWWPDTPGTACEIRFAHSPGRFDPSYLNSLRAFDAAFVLELDDGTHGIVGVDVEFHDWAKPQTPKPRNMPRNLEVARRSRAFRAGAVEPLAGRTELATMWLEHLLLLSMLQHESGMWSWGRYVVVHPAENSDFVGACARYGQLLVDRSTFSSITLEDLLGAGVLPPMTFAALCDRYLRAGA